MDIKHSRRILVVGGRESGALKVIKDLTGSAPTPDSETGSVAGLTHEWDVQTAYYNAKVPIWVDEITDTEAWETEFLKPEAREVIEAVGAWIYCFHKPRDGKISDEIEGTLRAIESIAEEHASYGADTVMLAVSIPDGQAHDNQGLADTEEWDDMCMSHGFEFIEYAAEGSNEYGEKVGFARLKEALEANEWATADGEEDDLYLDDLDFGEGDDMGGFGREEAEMTAELFGMKAALSGDTDFEPEVEDFIPPDQQAAQVEHLDRLMGKLMAVKEQSADLSEVQRKKMAAQAVRELMKQEPSV